MNPTIASVWLLIGIALMLGPDTMAQSSSPSARRDINAVLAAHDKELMRLPDVVGVYVGTLADQKTAALHVMLARKNAATESKIPRMIDGYLVIIEVTGAIRALDGR